MTQAEKAMAVCEEIQNRFQPLHRLGYFGNILCACLLIAWAYSKQVCSLEACNNVMGYLEAFSLMTALYWLYLWYLSTGAYEPEKDDLAQAGVVAIAKVKIGNQPARYLVITEEDEVIQSTIALPRVLKLAKSWEVRSYKTPLSFEREAMYGEIPCREYKVPDENGQLVISYWEFARIADEKDARKLYLKYRSDAEAVNEIVSGISQRFAQANWRGFCGTALDFKRRFWAAGRLFPRDFTHEVDVMFLGARWRPF